MNDALLDEIGDPSDWKDDWTPLRPLDSSLRCGLCYAGGKGTFCPNCRQKKAFDGELVAQPAIEAIANHWRDARSFLMKQWHRQKSLEKNQGKDKDGSASEGSGGLAIEEEHRYLRPRKRVAGTPDVDDVDYRALNADVMVQCPICQKEFDAVSLNAHLDYGCGTETATNTASMDNWLGVSKEPNTQANKKLTRPQYQLKSERDMRKLLEWVNLYNANLDAAPQNRESVAALKKILRQWEQSQDSPATKKLVSSENQARAWLKANRSQYADLAAQARASLHNNNNNTS